MVLTVPAFSLSILLVNDNGYEPERVEIIKTAITNSGYSFTFYDTSIENSAPSFALMSGFDLVIWYTGNDRVGLYFWDAADIDNEAIKQYIDGGGMMWVQGLDYLRDRYPETPVTFAAGDFVYDYLGIEVYFAQSHVDDGFYSDGVEQLDVIPGNPIFTLNPVKWVYETMWYVDACTPTTAAQTLYRMGPVGYDLDDYYPCIYLEKGDGKIVGFAFETARIDTQGNTDGIFLQGLDYFAQFGSGTQIYVTDISVYGEGNATTITENGATLQMYADILPEDATNQAVFWSVTPGTAHAAINGDGLLEASGSSIGNGTVWVKAVAADGSGISDSMEITISNQGGGAGGFEVLLVNDNANGADRYLVIDTTLANLGYTYDLANPAVTGSRPDFITLSNYDLVIWYTGNDGDGIYLWDVSDTLDYKFYDDLIQYIDGGGNVWLQGLDFMYDIIGGAPDEFSPGQFIHDYMGITKYVAQSHVDDGDEDGLPQLDVVNNNGISTFTPIKWVYETLWYADGYDILSTAKSMYEMGPSSYVLSGYTNSLLNKPNNGRIMTWAFETARIDTRANTETIFDEVLQYFESVTGVDEIVGLNIVANVYPNPATNQVHFEYELKNTANVRFGLYDITGRSINDVDLGSQAVGKHVYTTTKERLNLVPGVYFYQISVDNIASTGKIIFN